MNVGPQLWTGERFSVYPSFIGRTNPGFIKARQGRVLFQLQRQKTETRKEAKGGALTAIC